MKSVQSPTVNSLDRLKAEFMMLWDDEQRDILRLVNRRIQMGEVITGMREELPHGEFMPWVERELPIQRSTAQKCMGLFKHRDELPPDGNLTACYKQVEQLETEERQQQRREQRERQKPADKESLVDLDPQKPAEPQEDRRQADEAEEAFNGRVKEHFDRPKEEPEERKRDPKVADLLRRSQEYLASHKKTEDFAMADLGENGSQDAMFNILTRYVSNLDDASRQMEAAHNLIKFLKQLVNELQRQSVDSEQGGES